LPDAAGERQVCERQCLGAASPASGSSGGERRGPALPEAQRSPDVDVRISISKSPAGSMHCLHQARIFLLVLVFGAILSAFWFSLHYQLTTTHERDSRIINYIGSLRYHTEHIGSVSLASKYLPTEAIYDKAATFSRLEDTVAMLMGKATPEMIDLPSFPDDIEILDNTVKAALEKWVLFYLDPISDSFDRLEGMNGTEVSSMIKAVQVAIEQVDLIVIKATEASTRRVKGLMNVSIIRLIIGFIWGIAVSCSFVNVWRPYVFAFNRLQVMEQQTTSILRSAFDAVVTVSSDAPFRIVSSNGIFDDLLGRPMQGQSVLSCAVGKEEQLALANLLDAANGSGAQQRTWLNRFEADFWWKMVPQKSPETLPVAAMISTQFQCGKQARRVEVLVVNQAVSNQAGHNQTLLVVREVTSQSDDELVNGTYSPEALELDGIQLRTLAEAPRANSQLNLAMASSISSQSLQDGSGSVQSPARTYRTFRSSAGSRRTGSDTSASTVHIVGHPGNGPMSPRSGTEGTPPPSMVNGVAGRGQIWEPAVNPEFILRIEEAMQSLPERREEDDEDDVSVDTDATPPMRLGAR